MKKSFLILAFLLTPSLVYAEADTQGKAKKVELINQLATIRDQAIERAQTLDEAEKSEAIAEAQAAFWAEIDPILSQKEPEKEASTLVKKALAAIKSIFQ